MHNHTLQLALVALIITLVLQALAPRIPPTLLQAARLVQIGLGVFAIYVFAMALMGRVIA